MKSKTVAIIPIRKNSQRIKNKNFINFYKGKSLLELKIEQLKKVNEIDEIVVSSDSLKAKKIADKYKISFQERDKYYASSKCSAARHCRHCRASTPSAKRCTSLGRARLGRTATISRTARRARSSDQPMPARWSAARRCCPRAAARSMPSRITGRSCPRALSPERTSARCFSRASSSCLRRSDSF
mgnify:CR=1 FL=1